MWFLIILVVIIVGVIAMYNSLVRLRVRVDNAWHRRSSGAGIPNLLETTPATSATRWRRWSRRGIAP